MITIVSGLPRSGTSLMMQMLDAGGLLRRRGNSDSNADTSAIEEAFQRHPIEVNKWLAGKANVQVCPCIIIACCANRKKSPKK